MEAPLVSVITPCYNHEKYVKEAIESVIQQTYENIELIIINDGSANNSHRAILEMANTCEGRFKRFEYINKENEGVTKALNVGIDLSNGKYVSFLASDDIIDERTIEILAEILLTLPMGLHLSNEELLFTGERVKAYDLT